MRLRPPWPSSGSPLSPPPPPPMLPLKVKWPVVKRQADVLNAGLVSGLIQGFHLV